MPEEPWSELEKAVLFSALVPYVFRIDPRRGRVSFYLPAETALDPTEMNGLFESWSETIDWAESLALDSIGMPMARKALGVVLEVDFAPGNGFNLIYEEAMRRKRTEGIAFLKHRRGLEILIYDNYTA